jgi:hypothetical protein
LADGGLHVYDGRETRFGTQLAEIAGSSILQSWAVPNVGIFIATQSTGANVFIQKVTNPDDRDSIGVRVLDAGLDTLGRCFVDCGWHTLAAGDRHVLLYFEYGATGDMNVQVSKEATDATAGDSGTWSQLFIADAVGIDHFHGGTYVKGKGLYVFTGDGGSEAFAAAICFAAEGSAFISLIDDAETWYAADHWALGDRSVWPAQQDPDFVVGAGFQTWRTVDLVTADGRNAYWIPDHASGTSDIMNLNKLDLYDTTDSLGGTLSVLKTNLQNIGWYGGTSQSGLVYLSTATVPDTPNMNDSSDIWVIDPEDDSFALVKTTHADEDPLTTGFYLQTPLFEYGGAMFGRWLQDKFNPIKAGVPLYPDAQLCGRVDKQKKATVDILAEIGSFQSGDQTGWADSPSNDRIAFDAGTVEISIDDDIVGSISGATATVSAVDLDSGAWDGSGVGTISFDHDSVVGVFQENELIKVGAVENATVNGILTLEVIADPTGQLGGNVLRIVSLNQGGLPAFSAGPRPVLTTPMLEYIIGNYVTFSAKLWVDPSSDDFVQLGLYNWSSSDVGAKTKLFRKTSSKAYLTSSWVDIHLASIASRGSASPVNQYKFIIDDTDNGGKYLLAYVTDFQIVKGAVPNNEIERISSPSGSSVFGTKQSIYGDN